MSIAGCCLPRLTHGGGEAALAALFIPGAVFWAYFAGTTLLGIGIVTVIKNDLPQAHGLDKALPFGRLFLAIPMAVFGTEHFSFPEEMVRMVPSWIPAHRFWVYLVGTSLIAAALSIVIKKYAQLAATLLGIMLLSFVFFIHIPNLVAEPRNRILWAVALRDLSFSGGALALAGRQMKPHSAAGVPWLVTLARFFVGVPALLFGVEHFLHPDHVPGVPLELVTPAWIPARLFWAYLGGVVLVITGTLIVANQRARLAATCLGIMIFLLVLFVYLPITAASPTDIDNGLNYFVDTLVFSGAALVLADALPKEGHSHA